ncbi:MAG: STAS domain-containing protein [Planctomycetota bacterium]
MSHPTIFETEIQDATLIVAPRGDVSTLAGEDVHAELLGLLDQLQLAEVKYVVIDLKRAAYFGSSMLGAMNALWGRVRPAGGNMALCNVSETGLEILQVSKFDTLWPIFATREEALKKVIKTT